MRTIRIRNIIKSIVIALILLTVVYFLTIVIMKNYIFPIKYIDTIKEEAAKNNLDPYLILSIIKSESGFDKEALSRKQAKGLMQVMDSTASDMISEGLENTDIYDVDTNIALGCKYFAKLVKKYNGNYYLAVCAYNAGMGNVDKWIASGVIDNNLSEHINVNLPFGETSKYLNKVISSYRIYRYLYK